MGGLSSRLLSASLLGVVDAVYAAALDLASTSEAVSQLNELLGGALTQLMRTQRDRPDAVLASDAAGMLVDLHTEYVTNWVGSDPRLPVLSAWPGVVLRSEDANVDLSGEFYRDFLCRRGCGSWIAGACDNEDGTVTVVSCIRYADAGPFDSVSVNALGALLPHLKRSEALRTRAAQHAGGNAFTREVFDVLPAPLLLIDSAGRCLESNAAFASAAAALSAATVFGRLRFAHPDVQRKWETALAQVVATAAPTSMIFASGARQWKVNLLPVASALAKIGDARLILAFFEERHAAPAPANFAINGRLTRSEMEVLAGLMQGLSAKEIAAQRSASVHTVRTQITSILDKSGHKSQRELIAAFGASAFLDSRAGDSFMSQ